MPGTRREPNSAKANQEWERMRVFELAVTRKRVAIFVFSFPEDIRALCSLGWACDSDICLSLPPKHQSVRRALPHLVYLAVLSNVVSVETRGQEHGWKGLVSSRCQDAPVAPNSVQTRERSSQAQASVGHRGEACPSTSFLKGEQRLGSS